MKIRIQLLKTGKFFANSQRVILNHGIMQFSLVSIQVSCW
jgi:hypothetical protein